MKLDQAFENYPLQLRIDAQAAALSICATAIICTDPGDEVEPIILKR